MFSPSKVAITKIQTVIIAVVVVIALLVGGAYYSVFLRQEVPSEIKIGVPISLSGFLSVYYESRVWLLNKWVDTVNAEGGIYLKAYGRKLPVKVILADDESNAEKGVESVTKLITRDQVDLLSIVSILPIVLAEVEVSERYKVPCIVCSGFDKPYEERALEKPWQYTWIEAMSLEGMISGCLALMETVKTNKIIALHAIDNPDGRYPGLVLEDMARKRGFTLVNLGYFPEGTTDFSSYIMKWKEENVEIIYSAAPSPYVQELVRQCVRYGFWPKMIFAQMMFFLEDLDGIGGSLGDGICAPFFWTKEYPDISRELAETYMEEFKKYYVPDLGVSYSGLQVIKDVLERAGSLDKDAINNAFSETDLMTVEGRVKFDPNTHVSKWPTVVIQWRAYGAYGWTIEVVYSPHPEIKTTAPLLFPLPPPR